MVEHKDDFLIKVGGMHYLSQRADQVVNGVGALSFSTLVHGSDSLKPHCARVTQEIHIWDGRGMDDNHSGFGNRIFHGTLINLLDALETLPLVRAGLVRMATAARDGIQLLQLTSDKHGLQREVLEVLAHDLEALAELVQTQTEIYGIPAEPVATAYTVPETGEPKGEGPEGSSN